MKFGKVDNPELVDFSLPQDHLGTEALLKKQQGKSERPKLFVGFPTWNKTKLANFYPRGTKDELVYYSSQFNAIELNATFYRIFPKAQFEKWRDKTPDDFVFFPKYRAGVFFFIPLVVTSFFECPFQTISVFVGFVI